MEQEGGMSSREYHKCVSEAYYTRALLWTIIAARMYEHVTQSYEMWLVVAIAIFAVSNLICSYIEYRRAE